MHSNLFKVDMIPTLGHSGYSDKDFGGQKNPIEVGKKNHNIWDNRLRDWNPCLACYYEELSFFSLCESVYTVCVQVKQVSRWK